MRSIRQLSRLCEAYWRTSDMENRITPPRQEMPKAPEWLETVLLDKNESVSPSEADAKGDTIPELPLGFV